MSALDPSRFLQDLFQHSLTAVSAETCLPPYLAQLTPPRGRTVVLGAGKAAAAMAYSLEQHWTGPLCGMVVTRYGHECPCHTIEVLSAAHPVPDTAGLVAAQRMLGMVQGLTAHDLVICLISGGGSALLSLPAPGISLVDKQALNRALLNSGATITEINCVRKHLSAIKGGRLALSAAPARVATLIISDVPGDMPDTVASGPTLPDSTSCKDALAILKKYALPVSDTILAHLHQPVAETPKPGDPRFALHSTHIIASANLALQAAAHYAQTQGIHAYILADDIEGEARDIALMHAAIARRIARHGQPWPRPCLLLSGGETSVTVRGTGHGGRNAEFLLALTLALNGEANVYAFAADTDGIDGSEDNAGARLHPDSLARAHALGLHPKHMLENNDGYGFFAALDDLLIIGPTRTNVNDLRAILIL